MASTKRNAQGIRIFFVFMFGHHSYRNIKKLFPEKYKNILHGVPFFFGLGAGKFHPGNIRIMFWENIRIFFRKIFFSDMGLESATAQVPLRRKSVVSSGFGYIY